MKYVKHSDNSDSMLIDLFVRENCIVPFLQNNTR